MNNVSYKLDPSTISIKISEKESEVFDLTYDLVNEKKLDGVIELTAIIFTIIYLLVSFFTGAWHITWILWLVFAAVEAIIKLVFNTKGEDNNE